MRVYLTGGTGFVGSNVAKLLTEWHEDEVFCAVHRQRPPAGLASAWDHVDLTDPAATGASVAAFEPDAIIHSAILNDFAAITADRQLGWDTYVGATRALADAAHRMGAKLVLVSTDWVFDGTQAPATEDEPPNPVNYYGVLKLASELTALDRCPGAAVARVSGVNGVHWARPAAPRQQDLGFGYLVASLVADLRAGGPFTVWEADDINMVATPSLASESAELMRRIVQRDLTGVFHCCGGESVGRAQLAQYACDVFGLDDDLVRTGPPDRSAMPGVRVPYDTGLDARRTAELLDYELPSVRELLEGFRDQLETGDVRPL